MGGRDFHVFAQLVAQTVSLPGRFNRAQLDAPKLDGTAVVLQPDVALGNLAPVTLAVGRREEFARLDVGLPAPLVRLQRRTSGKQRPEPPGPPSCPSAVYCCLKASRF